MKNDQYIITVTILYSAIAEREKVHQVHHGYQFAKG